MSEHSILTNFPPILDSKKHLTGFKSFTPNILKNVGIRKIVLVMKDGHESGKVNAKPKPDTIENKYIYHITLSFETTHLAYYHPAQEPFIPDFLVVLINVIENKCDELQKWNFVYKIARRNCDKKEAYDLFHRMLSNYQLSFIQKTSLYNVMNKYSLNVLIYVFQEFLACVKCKLIQINSASLRLLAKKPLYTQFQRANPIIKEVITSMLYRRSRTNADTCGFVMMHLVHMWEKSGNLFEAQLTLAAIYGPLLMHLEERPTVDNPTYIAPECALFLAMLDQCGCPFWDTITYGHARKAFFKPRRIQSSFVTENDSMLPRPSSNVLINPVPLTIEHFDDLKRSSISSVFYCLPDLNFTNNKQRCISNDE